MTDFKSLCNRQNYARNKAHKRALTQTDLNKVIPMKDKT